MMIPENCLQLGEKVALFGICNRSWRVDGGESGVS